MPEMITYNPAIALGIVIKSAAIWNTVMLSYGTSTLLAYIQFN